MTPLRARVDVLERRLAALERRQRPRVPASLPSDLAQLETLRRRKGKRYVRGDARGALVYAGAVKFGERESLWIKEHAVPDLEDLDAAATAGLLAALAHPARLLLARALVQAPRTRPELQAVIGTDSAGQLYHHLKEMMAAGIVRQSGRSLYEVPAERTVPLLTLLAAASDIRLDAISDGGTLEDGR
jgi:hypothetical protein